MNSNKTSVMIIPITGIFFLLKSDKSSSGRTRLTGFYHKSEKAHVDIRDLACSYLMDEGILADPRDLKLLGIMDTEDSGCKDEHMFVYTVEKFECAANNHAWSRFTNGQPSHVLNSVTRKILTSIVENKPLPHLNNKPTYCMG